MVESGRVPEKGRIQASTEKGSGKVLGKVESKLVPEKSRIRASIEMGGIQASTGEW